MMPYSITMALPTSLRRVNTTDLMTAILGYAEFCNKLRYNGPYFRLIMEILLFHAQLGNGGLDVKRPLSL